MASVFADTVPALLLARTAATPQALAYQYPAGGQWKSLSWGQTGDWVRAVACGLRALGLEDEQRCAILCSTRIEWIIADFGILCAGGAVTTIYPSNTAAECAYILKDCQAVVLFAENAQQLDKIRAQRAQLPNLKKVILIDGQAAGEDWVLTLDELVRQGRAYDAAHPGAYEATIGRVKKDWLATLIYTSGTTGTPKGVELTQDCWIYTAGTVDELGLLREDDTQYLWLPLAHVFGKVLEVAQIRIGFQTAVDGRVDALVENLGVIRPTFVAAVPRIFEKVHNKVVGGATQGSALKAGIFRWAMGVGKRRSALERQGQRVPLTLRLSNAIADRLVFSKLKHRFGGRLRFFVSGSAPLSKEIAEFFHAAGILILEGYGLTESSAASFVNRPHQYRFGTVGPPLPGTQVRIAPEDGEILIHSRGIMRGYHGRPAETKEALTPDGWLRTGDIGVVDADGFLAITDRKKDLIKTSGGKYVAPQLFEQRLKAVCPYVANVLVHGNNRNFCSALITLDPEAAGEWARQHGVSDSADQLAAAPRVHQLIQGYVDQVNAGLANYESVRKFAILPTDFSIEGGELTPSMKVKRKVVEERYRPVLERFYEGALERV